jgi:hypothetical protein
MLYKKELKLRIISKLVYPLDQVLSPNISTNLDLANTSIKLGSQLLDMDA